MTAEDRSSEEKLLDTPVAAEHRRLGARMGPFAGWNMPIRYPEGIIAEHIHTRSSAGLFDICHMGEFRIRGSTAADGLDRLLARSVQDQKVGTCRYNFLMTPEGTVRDDLIVYRLAADEFYLVVNAGTAAGDAAWVSSQLPPAVSFEDESRSTAKFDLQGPRTPTVLADLGVARDDIPRYFRWTRLELCGISVLLSRTGYTGEFGVEVYVQAPHALDVWHALLDHPAVKPVGLGARDTLRLEMGYPLYGHELDTDTTPVEAGFGKMLLPLSRSFVGAEKMAMPPRKQLVGFRLEGRRAARAGASVFSPEGDTCGCVTSGAFSPSLGYAVALGYVNGQTVPQAGTSFLLGASPERALPAVTCPLPFYREGTARAT